VAFFVEKMTDGKTTPALLDGTRTSASSTTTSASSSSLLSNAMKNLNNTDNDSGLPLIQAAENGQVERLTLLLNEIDTVDEHIANACFAAIRNNHFAALKLLVERGGDVVRRRGESWLRSVAWRNDDRMACLLLDAGAPLDHLTHVDLTNLVAFTKSVGVLTRLIARHVDVAALRDFNGGTLCHSVIGNAAHDDDVQDLLRAVVELGGVYVNTVKCNDITPLHYAAINRNRSALRILVELGADIDRQQTDGWTALHRVCGSVVRAEDHCAELLLVLGADACFQVTNKGQTACHLAAERRLGASLTACLAAGGELDRRDNDGDTPRMIANRHGVQLPTVDEIDAARRRKGSTRSRASSCVRDLHRTSIAQSRRTTAVRNHEAFVRRALVFDRVSPVVENRNDNQALS
jgi:ankyrin repeat protein